MWLLLSSVLLPARRTLSHGYRRAKEAGDQPHSWKLWGHKQLLPWPADPSCFLSLCHLPVAPWSPGPPLIPQHHCDWGLHCGMAKFICCQALYIPHNSVFQALLCMCLIFTIKKTNGKSDRPDTLEGWALARPRPNLGMNSISGLRLYFMYNTPVIFKSP